MSDIEHCDQCEDYFLSRPLMQAEVRHEGVHGGESAARSHMLELMEPIHEQHTQAGELVDRGNP